MENVMNASTHLLHNLILDQQETLNEQSLNLNQVISVIDRLGQEYVNLTTKLKEMELKLYESTVAVYTGPGVVRKESLLA